MRTRAARAGSRRFAWVGLSLLLAAATAGAETMVMATVNVGTEAHPCGVTQIVTGYHQAQIVSLDAFNKGDTFHVGGELRTCGFLQVLQDECVGETTANKTGQRIRCTTIKEIGCKKELKARSDGFVGTFYQGSGDVAVSPCTSEDCSMNPPEREPGGHEKALREHLGELREHLVRSHSSSGAPEEATHVQQHAP